MNLKSIIPALLAILILPALNSCDKDDDNEIPGNGKQVSGTYRGSLAWNVMGQTGTFEGSYEVKILADDQAANNVNVVLPECKFVVPGTTREVTIPSVVAKDAKVSESGNVYTIACDEFQLTVGNSTYSGEKLEGKIAGKDMSNLVYTITPGTMPMPINFTFSGTLQ